MELRHVFWLCALFVYARGQMTLMSMEPLMNNRTSKQVAAIVTGIPILQLVEYGMLDFFREEVMNQRILIFKKQGTLTPTQQKKVAKYFGSELDSYPRHPATVEKEILMISNDKAHGVTNVGSRGWHIDGFFHEKPHSHGIYHMTSIAKKGPTIFIPLDDIVDALPPETKTRWDRLWIRCRVKTHIVHPLIYHHPVTGFETMCFHMDYVDQFIWDYGTAEERVASEEEKEEIMKELNEEFDKDNGYWYYVHNWEEGDVIVTDNLSVGHIAHPDTQLPKTDIGLRLLQRASVLGRHKPKKNPGAPKPQSKKLADDEGGDFDEDDEYDEHGQMYEKDTYTFDAREYMKQQGEKFTGDGQAFFDDSEHIISDGLRQNSNDAPAVNEDEFITDDGEQRQADAEKIKQNEEKSSKKQENKDQGIDKGDQDKDKKDQGKDKKDQDKDEKDQDKDKKDQGKDKKDQGKGKNDKDTKEKEKEKKTKDQHITDEL